MKIGIINVYKVTLPFKATFSHAQKDATSVDNVVVEILTDDGGLAGYGEGGPRPYVTGETQDTAIRDVRSLCLNKRFPWVLDEVSQIWGFVDSVIGEKSHNAALCALEMALLDLLAKNEGQNILHYLPKDHIANEVTYGGTTPIAEPKVVRKICEMMAEFGIRCVRLKMGNDFEQNRRMIEAVSQVTNRAGALRVDVNGAWNLDIAKQHIPLLKFHGVAVLEQPLMPDDHQWEELYDIVRTTNIRLMADESVCSLEDMENAVMKGYFDVVNVRLSKCGGFYNSLRIIQRIRDAGLDYQVGCQLGESGILSAAGRALCAISSDALYFDGSYDTFLLRENLTIENVTFGYGGKAVPLKEPGLGIIVDKASLDRFSNYVTVIKSPCL